MLNVNLFHEIQRIEFERRWDPVKIAVYVFVFGLVVVGLLTGLQYMAYKPARQEVAQLQKEIDRHKAESAQAEMRLKEWPQYQNEFALLKRRAEQKKLQSRYLEVFKNSMPANLFVNRLSVTHEMTQEKIPGPRNKKGLPTFTMRITTFNMMRFEATLSGPDKPSALEEKDRVIEKLQRNEVLKEIAAEAPLPGGSEVGNKMKSTSSTSDPVGNEPAIVTINVELELKK